MKITKSQLKRVIKEELKRVLHEQYTSAPVDAAMDYTPAGEEIGSTSLRYDPTSRTSINQAFKGGDISSDEWRDARRAHHRNRGDVFIQPSEWRTYPESPESMADVVSQQGLPTGPSAENVRTGFAPPAEGERMRPQSDEAIAGFLDETPPDELESAFNWIYGASEAPPAAQPETPLASLNWPEDIIDQSSYTNLPLARQPEHQEEMLEEDQTKSQLKQIIQEELESDPALLSVLERLIGKLDNLDSSVDYLAALMSGVSPQEIELSQTAFGRLAGPGAGGTEL